MVMKNNLTPISLMMLFMTNLIGLLEATRMKDETFIAIRASLMIFSGILFIIAVHKS